MAVAALVVAAAGCGTSGAGSGSGPGSGGSGAGAVAPGAPTPGLVMPSTLPTRPSDMSLWPTEAPEPEGPCPASGVRVSLGITDGALGLRAMGVLLDNCGTRPFEVSGYPDVAVLDERREDLEVTVRRGTEAAGGTARPTRIVLRPGQRAQASVMWRNTVTRADVPATSGAYLRVRPAPGVEPQTVAPHDGPMDLGNTGAVDVTPWQLAER